jgi:hypothetical protein
VREHLGARTRGGVVLAGKRQRNRQRDRVLNRCPERDSRKRVIRHALQRFLKRSARLFVSTVAMVNRPDGLPAIGARLARIKLAIVFEFELARQFVERAIVLGLRREHQPVQQMQTHGLESAGVASL